MQPNISKALERLQSTTCPEARFKPFAQILENRVDFSRLPLPEMGIAEQLLFTPWLHNHDSLLLGYRL